MENACHARPLARDGLCAVDYCPGCGAFHVKVGFVRLNLDPESFAALSRTLEAALALYRRSVGEGEAASSPEGRNALH